MNRYILLLAVVPLIVTPALAGPHVATPQQQDEFPEPTPLDDPYAPPAGDPDIFAPEPDGEPGPLNPADN
jgi:hypothetical protein